MAAISWPQDIAAILEPALGIPQRVDAAWFEAGTRWAVTDKIGNLQLTLEVLHNIQELVVHLWLLRELRLDRIEIAERIAHIELPFRTSWVLFWRTNWYRVNGRRAFAGLRRARAFWDLIDIQRLAIGRV